MRSQTRLNPWLVALFCVGSIPLNSVAFADNFSFDVEGRKAQIYVGAAAAISDPQSDLGDSIDPEWSGSALYGARINRYASGEIAGSHFGTFSSGGSDLDVWSISPSLMFHYPIWRVDPFAGFGLGYLGAEGSATGDLHGAEVHAIFGLNVWLTERIALRVDGTATEAIGGDDGVEKLDFLTGRFGVVVQFP